MTNPRDLQPSAADVAEAMAVAEQALFGEYRAQMADRIVSEDGMRRERDGFRIAYYDLLGRTAKDKEEWQASNRMLWNTYWVLLVLFVAALVLIAGMVGMKG